MVLVVLMSVFLMGVVSAIECSDDSQCSSDDDEICFDDRCIAPVFKEDFLTSPDANGKWNIERYGGSSSNVGFIEGDGGEKAFVLTKAMADLDIKMIVKDYDLPESDDSPELRKWIAKFSFYTGRDAISSYLTADGIWFLFNAQGPNIGYAIELDNWKNTYDDFSYFSSSVGLIKNGFSNHLVEVEDSRVKDGNWHDVIVNFDNGHVIVHIDNDKQIDYTILGSDEEKYANSKIGFYSTTGVRYSKQAIKDFKFYEVGCAELSCDDRVCGIITNDCGDKLDCGESIGSCEQEYGEDYVCNEETGQCVYECPENQVIMKLASSDNSHGALYDDSDYSYNICYEQIFGEAYVFDPADNPHECKGDVDNPNNLVLWLSAINNAHASITKSVDYDVPICYGNLNCHVVGEGGSCDADEEIVVKLSSETNAHISDASASSNYNYAVCCKSYSVTGPHWENMNNVPITNADLDDLVKLVVPGTGLTQEIEYTIYRKFEILSFWRRLKVAQFETRGFTTWKVGKKEDGSWEDGEYYFIATINGKEFDSREDIDGDIDDNQVLTVSDEEHNTAPVTIITSPETRQIYFLGEQLNFNHEGYDVDDEFNYTWDLGNGVVKKGDSLNLGNKSFLYAYESQEDVGQKDIILTVEDDRGLVNRSKISILILNSSLTPELSDSEISEKYVLAYINEPEFYSNEGRRVEFDASGSYVIEYVVKDTGGVITERNINCLSGNCTLNTKGCYPTDPSPTYPACQINVNPDPPEPIGYIGMIFSWVFDDNPSLTQIGISFPRNFPSVKRYKTNLSIDFNVGLESLTSSTLSFFNVYFEEPVCFIIEDELDLEFISGSQFGESYWVESSYALNSLNHCLKPNGITPEGDAYPECCPLYYSCNSEGKCIYSGDYKCQDFEEEDDCNGNEEEAKNELNSMISFTTLFKDGCDYTLPYGSNCEEYVSCYCEWDDNICKAVADHRVMNKIDIPYESWDYGVDFSVYNPICTVNNPPLTGKCTYDISYTGDCLEGDDYVLRSWFGVWNGDEGVEKDNCEMSGSDTISCEHVVKLSFFNWVNFVVVILSLIGIYGVMLRRK